MMAAVHLGSEIHPLSVRRPRRRHAVPVWTYLPPGGAAIHWNHAAGMPDRVHFHYKSPFAVGRCVGEMRHRTFMLREINLAIIRAIVSRGHNSHVRALALSVLFREEE